MLLHLLMKVRMNPAVTLTTCIMLVRTGSRHVADTFGVDDRAATRFNLAQCGVFSFNVVYLILS